MLTIITPAAARALTTVDATKAELRETGAGDDGWFALSIDRATAAIEHWCRRSFAAETVRESVWLTGPAESVSLSRWPVLSVASLLEGGAPLPPDAFEVDGAAGLAYRLTGPDTRRMWRAGRIVATYTAGYVLPGDPGRTLPEDLERAAIMLVRNWWYDRDRDPLVKAEQTDSIGRTEYWVGAPAGGATLPPEVEGLLQPYRQIPVGG
jgi:hypothetical protein